MTYDMIKSMYTGRKEKRREAKKEKGQSLVDATQTSGRYQTKQGTKCLAHISKKTIERRREVSLGSEKGGVNACGYCEFGLQFSTAMAVSVILGGVLDISDTLLNIVTKKILTVQH